ncbi:MAG: energy-coupling factor ABC transporter ATP-binding protein [Chloroflexota bacterium]|nr:energy-coupling factor ABC transporter ATP-binding protein [Chloroflexota bacterium]
MLTFEGVSYRYAGAERASLRDVELELHDGEVVGLAGANESGKSTLCLLASGLAPRSIGGTLTGRILLDGVPTAGRPMHELAARIGIAFQNPGTQLSGVTATVYEEVAFGPMNLGLPLADVIGRTRQALVILGIDALAERDPARLSGGQQQLTAIASLLAMRPRHLVLDDPTAQLDPAGTRMVGDALARLAREGTSILVAEHKTDLLADLVSRVVVLASGRVALDGPARSVLGDPRLLELGVAEPSGVRLARLAREAGLPQHALDLAAASA